jgi:predicted unusual protein kinase regulating ubiquinone biosynthesis (AarF/ABC1/UbiB family)
MVPETKWKRTLVGGKTAAHVSGKVLKYLVKKPFLNQEERESAKQNLEQEYAREIFKGLVLLKGTALKIAQLLSLELDLIPEVLRKELEKSYNQVPPINKALVRKMVYNAFGRPPEAVFSEFDHSALAAASLGQVHRASDSNGKQLAVKVQYPGIGKTIRNDLQIVRNLVRPTAFARFALPVLEEIEAKLQEEIDYLQEAENTEFFHANLKMDRIVVPGVMPELCTRTVLTTEFIEGKSLTAWIADNPSQEARDSVANTLYSLFLNTLLKLQCLHADPNPGNFIVMNDNRTLGLVDFGCVKRFSQKFVQQFKEIFKAMVAGDKDLYFQYLDQLQVLRTKIDPATQEEIYRTLKRSGDWFGKIYQTETFDFSQNTDFIEEGKKIMQEMYPYRKYFQPNPEFVYLNRTHYGLIRIFEKLQARVKFIHPDQWEI